MWLVFLDEFGHDGYYNNRQDKKYGHSPLFGLGGIMIPAKNAHECIVRYNYLKVKYHGEYFRRKEKKGNIAFHSSAFKKSYKTRKNIKDKGNMLLRILDDAGGKVIYHGFEKYVDNRIDHKPQKLHLTCTRRIVADLNSFCKKDDSRFVLVFDGHSIHPQRMQMVDKMSVVGNSEKNRLANSPYDLESDMHSCIQMADWICALLAKIISYEISPQEWKSNKIFHDSFSRNLSDVSSPICKFKPRQKVLIA